MNEDICLGSITMDCSDAKKLSEFYAALLGWEKINIYGKPGLRGEKFMIIFVQEDDYVPPIWPEQAHEQQKQIHLDFLVSNLSLFVQRAESLGAVKAKTQFGGAYYTTMIDPAGHPFCLCAND